MMSEYEWWWVMNVIKYVMIRVKCKSIYVWMKLESRCSIEKHRVSLSLVIAKSQRYSYHRSRRFFASQKQVNQWRLFNQKLCLFEQESIHLAPKIWPRIIRKSWKHPKKKMDSHSFHLKSYNQSLHPLFRSHQGCEVHLLEVDPKLVAEAQARLGHSRVTLHDGKSRWPYADGFLDLPCNCPFFCWFESFPDWVEFVNLYRLLWFGFPDLFCFMLETLNLDGFWGGCGCGCGCCGGGGGCGGCCCCCLIDSYGKPKALASKARLMFASYSSSFTTSQAMWRRP